MIEDPHPPRHVVAPGEFPPGALQRFRGAQRSRDHHRPAPLHQAIAEAIGSTRVTITRLLGDLRNAGLVEIDRKKIAVLDPIALAKKFSMRDLQVTMVAGWPERFPTAERR